MENQKSSANRMCSIYGTGIAVPVNNQSTEEMLSVLGDKVGPAVKERIRNLGVQSRYSIVKNYAQVLAGVEKRVLINSTTDLALEAIDNCLEDSDVKFEEVTLLITLSNTVNQRLPCFGYELLDREPRLKRSINILNMENQGCSALLKAVDVAHSWTQQNKGKALIVTSDTPTGFFENCVKTPLLDYAEIKELDSPDKTRSISSLNTLIAASLFGDGAAALVIGEFQADLPKIGFYSHLTNVETIDSTLLSMNEGGILQPQYIGMPKYRMSKFVPQRGAYYAEILLKSATDSLAEYLKDKGLKSDFMLCHTGSRKILQAIQNGRGHEGLKMDISYEVLENFGNLSGSSLGFMVACAVKKNKSQSGVIVGFGVGFSASSAVLDVGSEH